MGELTSRQFWADVGVRAIRTMAQTAVGVISAGAVMSDVDWIRVASASGLAGLVSVLMSLDRIGTGKSGANVPPPVPGETTERTQVLTDGATPTQPKGDGLQ